MYVVLGLIFLMVLYAGTLLGQKSRPVDDQITDSMEKRLKMREEMHRRMMEKLLKGVGPDQDMFKDMEQFLDEVMSDSFNGIDSFTRTTAQNYQMVWNETKEGRTLVITPQSPSQQLDISVSNGLINIKGKSEQKSQHGVSVMNFSNSFNVPADCNAAKVKMDSKDGKIFVHFPFLKTQTKKDGRRPIGPTENDVQI
jgi:HSP20 family molecular chaperone IbpA